MSEEMSLLLTRSDGKILNIKIIKKNEELKFIQDHKGWISKTFLYYEKLVYQYGGDENLRTDKIFFFGEKYDVQLIKDRMSFVVISENLKLITFHIADKRKYKDDIKKWYATQT